MANDNDKENDTETTNETPKSAAGFSPPALEQENRVVACAYCKTIRHVNDMELTMDNEYNYDSSKPVTASVQRAYVCAGENCPVERIEHDDGTVEYRMEEETTDD